MYSVAISEYDKGPQAGYARGAERDVLYGVVIRACEKERQSDRALELLKEVRHTAVSSTHAQWDRKPPVLPSC